MDVGTIGFGCLFLLLSGVFLLLSVLMFFLPMAMLLMFLGVRLIVIGLFRRVKFYQLVVGDLRESGQINEVGREATALVGPVRDAYVIKPARNQSPRQISDGIVAAGPPFARRPTACLIRKA